MNLIFKDSKIITDDRVNPNMTHCLFCIFIKLEDMNSCTKYCKGCKRVYWIGV